MVIPGQVLYLADPYDTLVKEIASKLSKHELTGRNPKISLDRLSGEMVAQYGGLFCGQYQVEIKLEYREAWEEFLNPNFLGKESVQDKVSPSRIDSFEKETSFGTNNFYDGDEHHNALMGTHFVVKDPFEFLKTNKDKLFATGGALANAYAGYTEIKGGAVAMSTPTGVGQVAGAYLLADGGVRILSTFVNIYGIWSEDDTLENAPHNLLG